MIVCENCGVEIITACYDNPEDGSIEIDFWETLCKIDYEPGLFHNRKCAEDFIKYCNQGKPESTIRALCDEIENADYEDIKKEIDREINEE